MEPERAVPAGGGATGHSAPRVACWGLLRREECWRLSSKARLVFCLGVVASALFAVWGAHPFLAAECPVGGEYLVIEGWVPNYALEQGIAEFHRRHYRGILTTGCEILNGANLEPGDSHATYAAARLRWLGLDPGCVEAVPSAGRHRDRTYLSAVALREWFEAHGIAVRAIDILTVGAHARRSRLLYDKAFRGRIAIGCIPVADREYDPDHWWRSSEGVRMVIGEGLAYLYARLFFNPA